jgi:DNA-3-methyladenine glycosylase
MARETNPRVALVVSRANAVCVNASSGLARPDFFYQSRGPLQNSTLASGPSSVIAGIDFSAASDTVARQLIGMRLLVDGVGGLIVETEAYDGEDPASHSFSGPTARNAAMFGPPGCVYVYRSYGIHWCMNLVCREAGHGAGVLLRAIEPTEGLDRMRERRGLDDVRLLCAGPGRLGQALGIDRGFNGLPLAEPPFALLSAAPGMQADVVAGPRIGISKAVDQAWRFGLAGSRFLSRPFPGSLSNK